MSKIIDAILQQCKNERITQKEIAEKTGVTEAAMSRYFNKNRSPRVETAEKMLDACGLEIVIKEK